MDWQKDDGSQDSSDYLAWIKDDLLDEEVFVFTPNGDEVGLHKVSRAVDFAYRSHFEIGNHRHGVRINDRLCPLATPQHLVGLELHGSKAQDGGSFMQASSGGQYSTTNDWQE